MEEFQEEQKEPHQKSRTSHNTESSRERQQNAIPSDAQTRTMATLVPDEVIYNVNDYTPRHFDACLMFGDISGFTELSEKYSTAGVAGPSRLTQELNKYLGAMVQEIMSHNGDVLKFSGDAFLAMWKTTITETMRDAVHEAIDCALIIQKSYETYTTEVGVEIKVKLAISAGPVVFSIIGEEKKSHYVIVGKPIWDVKTAELKTTAGDILVSPAAWHYTNVNEYNAEPADSVHMKILGVGPNWRPVQKNLEVRGLISTSDSDLTSDDVSSPSASTISNLPHREDEDEFSLRPAIDIAVRLNIKQDLRKFIITPVIKSIDMEESFEYLTEMRQVVVVFLNVVSMKQEARDLIELADKTYKLVCRIVERKHGCVNKVSLFDKDMMFLVIFGLRGLKHELESQFALQCAVKCRQAIIKFPHVTSCSVGVTTGKTYCGVFGHTLRREYTTISLMVNKAARIMVAYKDRVSCDRETFLHSKMQAKNFILLERRDLKGISKPGPIYEFREMHVHVDSMADVNKFPLLGRDNKVNYFKRYLSNFLKDNANEENSKKILFYHGEARQGKSRLLKELIILTPSSIPVNKIMLTKKDSKIPYETIRLIFTEPMGLNMKSSVQEVEKKLLTFFAHYPAPDVYCSLNDIFNTNFQPSEYYDRLTASERHAVLEKILRLLVLLVFSNIWVIAIDDCHYIDDHTWHLFHIFLDVDTIFIVGTVAVERPLHGKSKKIFRHDRVKLFYLKAIERWYHGGLACQFLNVYAIPPELEMAIQQKSNGNPGWIESFVISLLQSEGLVITSADMQQIEDMGLMTPPLYMIHRMNQKEIIEWQELMEERRTSIEYVRPDYWRQYIDTCRDTFVNVVVRSSIQSKIQGSTTVPVCLVAPSYDITSVDPELTIDVLILKTFDSLTSFEQLVVKCSAVCGDQFLRDMLLYVMATSLSRQVALAVKKLFEIKVLSCGRGDFLETGMIYPERFLNPRSVDTLTCYCRGLTIDDTCRDLPFYASCGYMQFRNALFRQITYNLLTDKQKKEFHLRAIKYLQKDTRKCRACGNGFFDKILGTKAADEFFESRKQLERVNRATDDVYLRRIFGIIPKRHSSSVQNYDSWSQGDSFVLARDHQSNNVKTFKSMWGFRYINKLKSSFSLTRLFSQEDFSECQCSSILTTTYSQLIYHCRGAGEWNYLIDAMVNYSTISISTSNIPLAFKILSEALDVLKLLKETENSWKIDLLEGKVYCLIGRAQMEVNELDSAKKSLEQSLRKYGYDFPYGCCENKIKSFRHYLTHLFGFYICPSSLSRSMDYWESTYCNNLSECLSNFAVLFMTQHEWKNAHLAAAWSLTKALEAFSVYEKICIAFSNLISVSLYFHQTNFCIALEVHSLRFCYMKENVDQEELAAIAQLYTSIFRARFKRAEMERAIQIGYTAHRISGSIQNSKTNLIVLPLLHHCLLMGQNINNAIYVLEEIDYFADREIDNSGRIWYFALSVGFHLETGHVIIPYHICEQFYQVECEILIKLRDPEAKSRYYAVMWLWCLRARNWEAAALWSLKAKHIFVLRIDSICNKFTSLYVLEGLLLYLCLQIDTRNIQGRFDVEKEIDELVQALEKTTKHYKIIIPRFYHLKAYYRFIKYNDSKTFTYLDKAMKIAHATGNILEAAWIMHSQQVWSRQLPQSTLNFWRDHCIPDNQISYTELNLEKIGFFSLPIPLYL